MVISFALWHFALYIFDRAYDYRLDAINQPREAMNETEKTIFILVSVILCAAPLVILPLCNQPLWPYLPFIPVTFLYNYPVYKGIRSKNIPFFKNLYSALFIWTLPLAVVAYFYTQQSMTFAQVYKNYFLGLFIYVMVGEAFWDIRDLHGDREQGVNTLPVIFGVKATKAYLFALIATDLFLFGKSVSDSTIIYALLILFVKPGSPRWIFHIPPLLGLYRFLEPLIMRGL